MIVVPPGERGDGVQGDNPCSPLAKSLEGLSFMTPINTTFEDGRRAARRIRAIPLQRVTTRVAQEASTEADQPGKPFHQDDRKGRPYYTPLPVVGYDNDSFNFEPIVLLIHLLLLKYHMLGVVKRRSHTMTTAFRAEESCLLLFYAVIPSRCLLHRPGNQALLFYTIFDRLPIGQRRNGIEC